jgi:hypothetical protein
VTVKSAEAWARRMGTGTRRKNREREEKVGKQVGVTCCVEVRESRRGEKSGKYPRRKETWDA